MLKVAIPNLAQPKKLLSLAVIFINAPKPMVLNNLTIITREEEKEELVEWFSIKGKIKIIPAWKFLLNS